MMATIGAYATKNTAVDVILMAVAGLAGFLLVKCKFNSSAMILGLVLGSICESNLRRAVTIIQGDTFWRRLSPDEAPGDWDYHGSLPGRSHLAGGETYDCKKGRGEVI